MKQHRQRQSAPALYLDGDWRQPVGMDAAMPPVRDSLTRGGLIPGAGQPAFELHLCDPRPIPVLIAVPHAGRSYPPDLTDQMRNPGETALRLEDRYVDLVALQLAKATGAALLLAHAPRAMIDLNRAPDDMDWSMLTDGAGAARAHMGRRARSGLGLVPRRLPGMGELWNRRLSAADLAARIENIHQPYHRVLGASLDALRDRWGAALLIDLHSMPPLGPKNGADAAPDFVLGDRFGASCGAGISLSAIDYFEAARCTAAHNRPYAGGYVLDRHGAPARNIHAIQIELCRTAYLDRKLRETGHGMTSIVHKLTGLVRRLASEITSAATLAEAAE